MRHATHPFGLLFAAAFFLASAPAMAAGKFDGSTPLLCVPITVTECGPDGDCVRVTATKVNLPQFLKVDLKVRTVSGTEETGRSSPVRNVEHLDGNLIIQGGQGGRGWSMAIAEATGKMSAAISSESEGFLVFGTCTILP